MANIISGASANSRITPQIIDGPIPNALKDMLVYLSEIEPIFAVVISLCAFWVIYTVQISRGETKVLYRFHVKENVKPIDTWSKVKDGRRLVERQEIFYSIKPEFTITNMSKFEWKIQKICVARLPWVKSIWVSGFGSNKGYKIKKLKILREILFDNGDFLQGDDAHRPTPIKGVLYDRNRHTPIKPEKERAIHVATYLPAMFLYEKILISETKKIGWLKANIDSNRYFWIAVINDRECLIGDRVECIGKEMRSRYKS